MSRVVLLDTGPLGMFANPRANPKNTECQRRVKELLANGVRVVAPGLAIYENRRKLAHLQRKEPASRRLARFDNTIALLGSLPWTDEVMRRASEVWGEAKFQGITTAPEEALDGDVILAAFALTEADTGNAVEIATTNTSDISRLYPNVINWDDLKT